jgi:hypothetical protein
MALLSSSSPAKHAFILELNPLITKFDAPPSIDDPAEYSPATPACFAVASDSFAVAPLVRRLNIKSSRPQFRIPHEV